MPSGAKKRKAAKKKKQSGAHTTITNNSNPRDEVKTQESDGSGLSSPISQDLDSHQRPFDVGGDPSAVGSFSSESKSMEGSVGNGEDAEKVVSEGEGVVEVVRESGSQVDAEGKTISIEHVQSSKSSSSSSSSDDDSKENEAIDSVVEEPSLTDSVPEQVSSLRCKDENSSSSNPSDDESRVDEKEVTEEAHNSVVEEPSSSVELVPEEVSQPKEEAPVGEVFDSVSGNTHDSDLAKPVASVPEEEIHVKECVSIQNSVAPEMDSEPKNVEDKSKTLPILNKNGESSSNKNGKVKVVSSLHNGTEHAKNSELPRHLENEHQLHVVAPRPVQTTSWKGCCGLFEVLVGSGR